MSVIFIVGVPCSGKSAFIKAHFPDTERLDWFDFQMKTHTAMEMLTQYQRMQDEVVLAAKEGRDLVVEHTLYKKFRRLDYIKAIRAVSDTDIDLYIMKPSMPRYVQNSRQRNIKNDRETKTDSEYIAFYESEKDMTEPIQNDEGFTHIYCVHDCEGDMLWQIEPQ